MSLPCPAATGNKRNVKQKASHYFRLRIAPFIMTLIIMGGQTWIAYSINMTFVWALPIVSGAMLISSILACSFSVHPMPSRFVRGMSIGVVVILTLINLVCMGWFVYDMLNPQTLTVGQELLISGFALWIVNVGVFALAYWELDTNGPENRALGMEAVLCNDMYPDFVFDQQRSGDTKLWPPNWRPRFADYLYLAITTALAFAPVVPTPVSVLAKMLMGAEALISLVILGLIVARAVAL
jgi:hypothetical protein